MVDGPSGKLAAFSLSRRQLLTSSAASAVATVFYWAGSDTAALASATAAELAAATGLNRRTVSYFSGGHSLEHTWELATSMEVSQLSAKITEIRATFRIDPRVLAPRDGLIVQDGETYQSIPAADVTANGSIYAATYVLDPTPWARRRLRFNMPFVSRDLYPDDSIEGVAIPTVELTLVDAAGSSRVFNRKLATERTMVVTPWGLDIAPAWDIVSRDTDGNGFYRAPVAILLTSIGPNPTPAGVELEIRVAEAATGDPSVSTYSDGTQELPINQISSAVAADGTTRTVTLVIAESLNMGDRRRIDLAWPTIEPRTYSDAPPRGVVHLVTAGDNGAPRRGSAGRETLVDTSSDPAQLKNDMARKDG